MREFQEIEAHSDSKLELELRCGAERDSKKSGQFCISAASASFRDVRPDRDRTSA